VWSLEYCPRCGSGAYSSLVIQREAKVGTRKGREFQVRVQDLAQVKVLTVNGEKFSFFHVLLAGLRSSLCKKEIVHRKCNAPFPKKMKIQSVIISHYQVGFPSEKKQTSWIHVWLVACPVTVNHISVSSIAKRKDNKLWIQRYMPFHSNKIVFGSMNPLALF
jgi:hypothetical protein